MAADSTPMMQQWRRAKAQAPDAIVFFRLGDFYEMFFDDAVDASRLLDITLTARGKEQGDGGYPMCGVPVVAAAGHLARLARAGRRVAICEQVEDPQKAKGIVRREIVRIVTPGTAVDEASLPPSESCVVTAILEEHGRIGLAHADASTGELRYSEHDPGSERARVVVELAAMAPREIVVPAGADDAALAALFPEGMPATTRLEAGSFARAAARERIAARWSVGALTAFGLDARPAATRALGAVLAHLENTLRRDLAHLEAPRLVDPGATVGIDPSTIKNLELLESLAGGTRDSLAGVLDRTVTAAGGRTLRSWIVAPLRDPTAIDARLDAVEALVAEETAGRGLASSLEGVGDVERLGSRAVMRTATPRDLAALVNALGRLPALAQRLAASPSALLEGLAGDLDVASLHALRADLDQTIEPEPAAAARDGGVIREGRSPELDELRTLARDARTHLARLEASERQRTGISSLKVRHNKVFGYYLEVSQANLAKVPDGWRRRQTVATGERYTTAELEELEGRILQAHDGSVALECAIFDETVAKVAALAAEIRTVGRTIGTVDALASFARVATTNGYVRPQVDESLVLDVRGGRHPVVEQLRLDRVASPLGDGRFVPNDVLLDASSRQLVILTGPNMGGKSTYLRQVALIVLMAQAGSFVPAASARIGVVDRVFTRVGASDFLARGQSTFMVEMIETARILSEATPRSLVVLDEIGRGTSTFDGLSLAWAIAEHLHDTPRVAARALFATHYHELTELVLSCRRVVNLRMATAEWKGDIVFLHRVEEGAGDRSYGIQVARLAGIPAPVVARAREVLANLLRSELEPSGQPRHARHEGGSAGPRAVTPQLSLFAAAAEDPRLGELRDDLAQVDVEGLSPRQALDALADLQARARAIPKR